MLAKMCSDRNKPNGQCRISPERQAVLDFIKDLPIRKVGEIMMFIIMFLCILNESFSLKKYIFLSNLPSCVWFNCFWYWTHKCEVSNFNDFFFPGARHRKSNREDVKSPWNCDLLRTLPAEGTAFSSFFGSILA